MNINEPVIDIPGFKGFLDHEVLGDQNDTPPDAILVDFEVKKEYMPYLSKVEGRRVYKNFVHRTFIKELGFSSGSRRIKDKVEFNTETNEWEVHELAPYGQSDILKYPHAWKRFHAGNKDAQEGTPIETVFPHDPSRADMYSRMHITTLERLAAMTDADCQKGMGYRDDRDRAKAKLAKIEAASRDIAINSKIEMANSENAQLKARIQELENKLTQVLTQQLQANVEAPQVAVPVKLDGAPVKNKGRRKHPQEGETEGNE